MNLDSLLESTLCPCCGSNFTQLTGLALSVSAPYGFKCTTCTHEWEEVRVELNLYSDGIQGIKRNSSEIENHSTVEGFTVQDALSNLQYEDSSIKHEANMRDRVIQDKIAKLTKRLEAYENDPMIALRKKVFGFELEDNVTQNKPVFNKKRPKYVRLKNTCLRYREEQNDYYRDAGSWSVDYTWDRNNVLTSVSTMEQLHGVELVEVGESAWHEDNGRYV